MQAIVHTRDGIPRNINIYNALIGFQERGWECQTFETLQELEQLVEPSRVVVGGGGVVQRALQVLGRAVPDLPCYPRSLSAFLGRRITRTTLGEALGHFERTKEKVFIKPSERNRKLFTGKVLGSFRDLLHVAGLPEDVEVDVCSPVEFLSEYRVFLHRGVIVGARHYKGDFRIPLDFDVVDAAVAAFSDAPVACGMDFGITAERHCLLVEVNDAYALGSYGVGCVTYSRMIEDRWLQLVGLPLAI